MTNMSKFIQIGIAVLAGLLMLHSPITVKADPFKVKDRTIIVPKSVFDEKQPLTESGTMVRLVDSDYALEGLIDRVDFSYEVPLRGVNKGSSLNLSLEYSDLLLEGSTVTVLIDDLPVKSKHMKVNANEMEINVPLEGDMVAEGFHNITVAFYGHIADTLCVNEDNPANWFTISSTSRLFLNTKDFGARENLLEDYPYPFIQNNQDETIQGSIVIPNDASTAVLTAAMRLANYLNSEAAEDELVPVISEANLKKISTNIIAIGAADKWTGIIGDMFTSVNPTIPDNELVVSNYLLQFEKAKKQMMFITAEDDETISDNIAIVTDDHFIHQLAGTEISVDTLPEITEEKIEEDRTFSDLNIPNLTLTGEQTMSQNYYVQLPAYMDLEQDASLQLKLKVSDTLFQREESIHNEKDAELVVYVNGVPHSIAINDLNKKQEDSFYDIPIPIDAAILREGAYATIQFKAHGLRDPDFCVPPNDEKWIFVHEDSFIHVPLIDTIGKANFKSWPAPFVSLDETQSAVVLLPNEYDEETIRQLYILTKELGNQTTLDGLELIVDQEMDEQKLSGSHVIVLGGIKDHPSLMKYADELMIQTTESNELDVAAFEFLNETSKYAAWIQPSVWDTSKSMAIFSAVKQEDAQFISENIVRFIRTNPINTNIVVENMNGDIFTHKLAENEILSEETQVIDKEQEENKTNLWLVGGFVAIFLVSLIIFVLFYRKGKKDQGK